MPLEKLCSDVRWFFRSFCLSSAENRQWMCRFVNSSSSSRLFLQPWSVIRKHPTLRKASLPLSCIHGPGRTSTTPSNEPTNDGRITILRPSVRSLLPQESNQRRRQQHRLRNLPTTNFCEKFLSLLVSLKFWLKRVL